MTDVNREGGEMSEPRLEMCPECGFRLAEKIEVGGAP
jgi:transposase